MPCLLKGCMSYNNRMQHSCSGKSLTHDASRGHAFEAAWNTTSTSNNSIVFLLMRWYCIAHSIHISLDVDDTLQKHLRLRVLKQATFFDKPQLPRMFYESLQVVSRMCLAACYLLELAPDRKVSDVTFHGATSQVLGLCRASVCKHLARKSFAG